jgi:hypothetical protein
MRQVTQRATWAVVVAAGLLGGCLVEIRHVDDPAAAFGQARAEASRLQGRPGPAHRVNVLVFDEGDRKLVRVSLPLWLVRKIEKDGEFDLGDEAGDLASGVRPRLRLEEIEKAGLGILVEVEEDGGDQVLVWLS